MIRLLGGKGGADPNVVGKATEGEKAGKVPLLRVLFDSQKYKKDSDEITAGLVTALADVGADMNARNGRDGHCPLWLACCYRLRKTVKILLQSGAAVEKDEGGQALRTLSLLEAAGHGDEILLSLLLEARADPNRVGVFQRYIFEPPYLSMEGCMSPLQVVMRRLYKTVRGGGSEKEMERQLAFRITKTLIEHGARVPGPRSPTPSLSSPTKQPTDTDPLPAPQSVPSPLLLACLSFAAPVVSLLCEKGGADPNASGCVTEGGEAKYPFVSILSCEWSTSREAWGVLDALEKAGADPSILSSKYPPVFQPQTSSETMGTSSLAVKLINLAEARASPLLLQILQSASLEELQKGGIALASALYQRWKEGVALLVEREVRVSEELRAQVDALINPGALP